MQIFTDFLIRAIISFFSQRSTFSSSETLFLVASQFLRRALVFAMGVLSAAVLAVGGLFMAIVDLGNYLNAFGSLGLTYSGGLGLGLVVLGSLTLFFLLRSPLKLSDLELRALRANAGPSYEGLLASLIEPLQELLRTQDPSMGVDPRPSNHSSQPVGPAPETSMKNRMPGVWPTTAS
ncbi:MAG: hypothetical protein ACK5Y2_02235 [Bdellovibrionales bacterium]